MPRIRLRQAICALGLALVASTGIAAETVGTATDAQGLRQVSEFDSISPKKARSVALFEEAAKVITHPRCMNCHPVSERPTQTDTLRPHEPWVVRGVDGHGALGMRCNTCHQDSNYDAAGIPGHPKWAVAPASMAWQGKSLGEICKQLQDRKRNGGMDSAELIHHMAEDSLVGWGWNPGANQTPAPGTQAQFAELIRAWLKTGGHCPS